MQQTTFSVPKRMPEAAHLESLNRALDVLESLARRQGEVSLAELARSLGMSKAGVYRILATMSARGYVDKGPRRTYRLGLRAWELGCAVPELRLVTVAAPFMERVTSATHESSILGMLAGCDVVYLHRIDAFRAVRVHTEIGTRIPVHCTSTGLALLSRLSGEQLEARIPSPLKSFTRNTITDGTQLRAEIARAARRGYAVSIGAWREDVAGVAAPILDEGGFPIAAINVSLPRTRFTRQRSAKLGSAIQAAASEISRAMRFSKVTRDPLVVDRGLSAGDGQTTGAAPGRRRRADM